MRIGLDIGLDFRGIPVAKGGQEDLPLAATGQILSLWVGQVGPTSIIATARTDSLARETVLVASTSATFEAQIYSIPLLPDPDRFYCRGSITGLRPGTSYHLGVAVGGVIDATRVGRFRTPPSGAHSFTFGFASCSATGSNALIFDAIRGRAEQGSLDFFLHAGDMHYRGIGSGPPLDGASYLAEFHDAYDATFAQPRQNAAWRSVPMLYMWDDHDYGPDNSGASSPSRSDSVAAFRARVPVSPHLSGSLDAPYYSFRRGRVIFAVLDVRSERTSAGLISVAQEAWLVGIMQAAAPDELLIMQVGVPWQAASASDSWGGTISQRLQRARIAEAVNEHMPGRVVAIAGDMHALAFVSAEDNLHGGFPILQAAPLDRASNHKGGPYTMGPYPEVAGGTVSQYGVVEVDDPGEGNISLVFRGISVNRATGVETEVMMAAFTIPPVPVAPVIAGVAVTPSSGTVGTAFTAVPSLSAGTESVTYEYDWRLGGASVGAANANVYEAQAAGTLTCRVRGTNAAGSSEWVESVGRPVLEPAADDVFDLAFLGAYSAASASGQSSHTFANLPIGDAPEPGMRRYIVVCAQNTAVADRAFLSAQVDGHEVTPVVAADSLRQWARIYLVEAPAGTTLEFTESFDGGNIARVASLYRIDASRAVGVKDVASAVEATNPITRPIDCPAGAAVIAAGVRRSTTPRIATWNVGTPRYNQFVQQSSTATNAAGMSHRPQASLTDQPIILNYEGGTNVLAIVSVGLS